MGWGMIGGFGVGSDLDWDVMGGLGYQWTDSSRRFSATALSASTTTNDGFIYDVIQQGVALGRSVAF